jgi:peptidoglycan/LPS O-acetylase OafA/YrhL
VLGLVQAQVQPTAGFYLLPARAWELALGAWLAAGPVRWRAGQRTRCGREVASAVGVALIVLAMVAIKPDLPFPTPTALLPCVGVALVLAYGAGTRAAAWLAVAPLRWIGAISYSVYLWHWPIVTFYRLRAGVTLSMGAAAMLVRRRSAWARCRTI